jgi:hypothetical protein
LAVRHRQRHEANRRYQQSEPAGQEGASPLPAALSVSRATTTVTDQSSLDNGDAAALKTIGFYMIVNKQAGVKAKMKWFDQSALYL